MQLEWRNKYAIHGLVLYLAATIFICYLSFKAKQQSIHPIVWNTLFWIILLFSAVNAVGKSFTQESANRNIFYYTFAKPESVIFSKIIYNTLVMLGVSFIGAIGFASTLSLVAGIAAQGENSATLMAYWKILSIILLIYTVYAGFNGQVPRQPILNETIRNLYFHVTMWFTMIFLLGTSVYHSIQYLRKSDLKSDLIS
eukprot:gene36799-47984_t